MVSPYQQCDSGGWHCLVASAWRDRFTHHWLFPEFWGGRARPVTRGGRGSAWFVESDSLSAVLRHFSRGGMLRHLVEKHYVYTGSRRVRSHAEFHLLATLLAQGLPVPEPIAAGYQLKAGLFYQAALLMRRIPDARPLSDFSGPDYLAVWQKAGRCIRRFHDAGVYHADLNCMNVLVADEIYLIDFDRGEFRRQDRDTGWKQQNLDRLLRSVNKCLAGLGESERNRLWQNLMDGYHGSRPGQS